MKDTAGYSRSQEFCSCFLRISMGVHKKGKGNCFRVLEAAVYEGLLEKAVAELEFEVPRSVVRFAAEELSHSQPKYRTYSELNTLVDKFAQDSSLATEEDEDRYSLLDEFLVYHGFWHTEFYAGEERTKAERDTRVALQAGLNTLELPTAGPRQWIYHEFKRFEQVLQKARSLYDDGEHKTIIDG